MRISWARLAVIGSLAMLIRGSQAMVTEIPGGEDRTFLEKKLVKLLLKMQEGSMLGRPIANVSAPIDVAFGINLMQVLRVDEDAGQLLTNLWTHYRWRDPTLSWNHSLIDVDVVRIPAEQIWTPDVFLFNYADDRMRQHRSTLAVVNSTGHIDWIPTGIFKSTCSIDTYSFPFDEQVCLMTFRSLSMGIKSMTLRFVDGRHSMSLDSYVANPEWVITENSAIRKLNRNHSGVAAMFHDLTFTLRLKRRSVFHRYVLVLPCVLLSLTAGVLFMLPPESPAKIQIGIFIFQAFFLLLNLLKNSMPPSGSSTSIIGSYYSVCMMATTIVMFSCGFLVEVHFRADNKLPMSEQLRTVVIRYLARYLFIPIPKKNPLLLKRQRKAATRFLREARKSRAVSRASGLNQQDSLLDDDVSAMTSRKRSQSFAASRKRLSSWRKSIAISLANQQSQDKMQLEVDERPAGVLGDLVELRKIFQRVAEKQATKEYKELIKNEWHIAIMVFDRVFFFAYLLYIIWTLFLVLPQEDI